MAYSSFSNDLAKLRPTCLCATLESCQTNNTILLTDTADNNLTLEIIFGLALNCNK